MANRKNRLRMIQDVVEALSLQIAGLIRKSEIEPENRSQHIEATIALLFRTTTHYTNALIENSNKGSILDRIERAIHRKHRALPRPKKIHIKIRPRSPA